MQSNKLKTSEVNGIKISVETTNKSTETEFLTYYKCALSFHF
jgi:hypothetical protein